MLYHLKPNGRAGIVLANGSMSSSQNSEGEIRRAMVEADVVEVMIALPGQLFFNTQIPACLWFLTKQKTTRQGEVLFIDARKLGRMISRVQAELSDEVIERISGTVAAWRGEIPLDPPFSKGEDRIPKGAQSNAASNTFESYSPSRTAFAAGGDRISDGVQAYAASTPSESRPLPFAPFSKGEAGCPNGDQANTTFKPSESKSPPFEKGGPGEIYQDIPGYCRSVKLAEIAEHGHVLTPGRYVGAEAVEDDDEAFADKMQKLTEKLGEQMAKGAELDQLIRQKLGGLGYEF
jgi:type I restriction enzyme M protein